jgi:hypothetical protein
VWQQPGLFARGYERAFYKAVQRSLAGDTEEALAARPAPLEK